MKIYVAFNNCYYGNTVALGMSACKETLEEVYDYLVDDLLIKEYDISEEDTVYIDFPEM